MDPEMSAQFLFKIHPIPKKEKAKRRGEGRFLHESYLFGFVGDFSSFVQMQLFTSQTCRSAFVEVLRLLAGTDDCLSTRSLYWSLWLPQ